MKLKGTAMRVILTALLTICLSIASAIGPSVSLAEPIDKSQETQEQALAFRDQNEFGMLMWDTLETYPQFVADFAWEGDHGSVLTTADGLSVIRDFFSRQNTDLKITFTVGQPGVIAYFDRASVEMSIIAALNDANVVPLNAYYDPYLDKVVAIVLEQGREEAAQRIEQVVARASKSVEVRYGNVEDVVQLDATNGGRGYQACTGAFIAMIGSSYGILTASHFTTIPAKYHDSIPTGATVSAVSGNNAYDIRFTYLAGDSATNQVMIDSSGVLRTITNTGVVSTGMYLNKWGFGTGFQLAYVSGYAGCVTTITSQTFCGQYYTSSKVTDGGDSGGPWFSGNTAYGVHSGHTASASYFTPIAYAMNIANLKIRLS